jgi:hypothetical protein
VNPYSNMGNQQPKSRSVNVISGGGFLNNQEMKQETKENDSSLFND